MSKTIEPSARVPALRVVAENAAPVDATGDYVLYWMIAHRRAEWSFSLDRAVDWAHELGKPLLILEALRCDYPWASDRLHAFVLQGMADNARLFDRTTAAYYPYVEERRGEGKGLLEAFGERACVVVTDDFPCFFLPRMVKAAAGKLPVRLEKVDSNALLPMRATERVFTRAVDFRRFLQKTLPDHLGDFPNADPLANEKLPVLENLPEEITQRWSMTDVTDTSLWAHLPIDHGVAPVSQTGGSDAAEASLRLFLDERLGRYGEGRNDVKQRATSELSPYLHFGHMSAHQIFAELTRREGWNPSKVAPRATASRSGWWGMSEPAESFVDELVTWRELGYNMCWQRQDFDRYESLPSWARETLEAHGGDPRRHVYSLEQFEAAATHDELWNAAQRELVRDGRIHNYLRMLWGKKILEWSATPHDALAVMIELNNKYALDGRNPNSYSGIFWCLGRYDRAWGPERPIFGKVRYMSSESTRRKLDAKAYVAEFAQGSRQLTLADL